MSRAGFIGCHHWSILEQVDILTTAREGTILLLNTPYEPGEVFGKLPAPVQDRIVELGLQVWTVDAGAVARQAGLGNRTNTVLQTCFFAISGVLPTDEAVAAIKQSIRKTYGRRGAEVVARNERAVDASVSNLHRVPVPEQAVGGHPLKPPVPDHAPEFVRTVTAEMMAGRGDLLPVSALPVDGSYPSGTTAFEKRNISSIVAEWDPDTCIQCGNCSFVCPHSVIRSKYYPPDKLAGAPDSFQSAPLNTVGVPLAQYTLQVFAEDCTGCGLCVEACPVKPIGQPNRRAINLSPVADRLEDEKRNIEFFETIPHNDRTRVDFGTVRGTQYLQPLFEFSGACSGCGETPYVKLLSQLFGDRATVANATGCSSIYGGNLPTTPWTQNDKGRGPAWSNSLFEDNAEFGLGLRLAADLHTGLARKRLVQLREEVGPDLVDAILNAEQKSESQLAAQAVRVQTLKERLDDLDGHRVEDLRSVLDHLIRRSVWIVGGDGWAYDIGYGGLDHVLASGEDVNVLVLDTEVYSNTGGQSSKATPAGAVAKFATSGKKIRKKDLGVMALSYGYVYVAQVAMGSSHSQYFRAIKEAEAYPGPSLIICYSPCINHGIRGGMGKTQNQEKLAVECGYWHLYRYNPLLEAEGKNPFTLDSKEPDWSKFQDFIKSEIRYTSLMKSFPEEAKTLFRVSEENAKWRYNTYKRLAEVDFSK